MTKILSFRNHDQKVLFDLEIRGQLSDGHWENAVPNNHWRAWCEAETRVDVDNVGRNFRVAKDNYRLDSKSLLDVVAQRMIVKVRAARIFGADKAHLIEYLYDLDGNFRGMPTYEGDYWDQKRAEIEAVIAPSRCDIAHVAEVINGVVYGMRELRRDLRDMMMIMRFYNAEASL